LLENKEIAKIKPNRLINEKSPYLLQHAYNPVNWYPWGPEAFDKAKAEDKPVFVSIGYFSCHWCHVMEKECFEDVEVATLMNMAFVCIKVDREERPDLDATYLAVCQAMGRTCGWPLNVLLTPDKSPFFAASYIPKSSKFGLVGMVDLVPQVMEIWRRRRAELELTSADVKSRLETLEKRTAEDNFEKEVLNDTYEQLVRDFDDENGGFGDAPKFPRPHTMLFLLRYWKRSGEKKALAMVEKTLRQMRLGGIFDQVGFGFHRYSTDANWLVPHFEKMLYDQALLALAYTEAYQATGAGKFKLTAKETLDYVLRDLAVPIGGFYSAEDADTENEEGKFYLWTKQEVREAVQPEDVHLATTLFGVEVEGNYYDPATKGRNGKNILHFPKPLDEVASESGLTLDELIVRLGKIRDSLFETRKQRLLPAKDDKILTDWNGLMIAALAKASQVFGDQRYLQAATTTADFILNNMRKSDDTLYHRYAKGENAVNGFLDDYAFLTFGLIELYEATFIEKYLQAAKALTKIMIEQFWDKKNGGFYFAMENSEEALPRMKQVYDGAVPSGNSVALLNLLRLTRLVNESGYEELSAKIMRVFSEEAQGAPMGYTFLLAGVDAAFGPAYSVIVVGDLKEKETHDMLETLRKPYLPNVVVSLREPSATGLGYEQLEGKATAYVCRGQMCMPPTTSVTKMLELLEVG
jgi:uncharacterized protein YyaL (SSP411 family)